MWFVIGGAFAQLVLAFLTRHESKSAAPSRKSETTDTKAYARDLLFTVLSIGAFAFTCGFAYQQHKDAENAQASLSNQTGGDSEPFIAPSAVGEKSTRFFILASGHPIHNVLVTLTGNEAMTRDAQDRRFDTVSGRVPTSFQIDSTPVPDPRTTRPNDWLFITEASNGTFTERMWFKMGKCGWLWRTETWAGWI